MTKEILKLAVAQNENTTANLLSPAATSGASTVLRVVSIITSGH